MVICTVKILFFVWNDLKECFDKVSGPRTYQLHLEIVMTRQGLDSISSVFTKLRLLWDEYDVACALPHIEGDYFKKSKAFSLSNGIE